jgi:hypothetical protein
VRGLDERRPVRRCRLLRHDCDRSD